MSKPSRFILSTDFATLANDDRRDITFALPSSVTYIAGQDYPVFTLDTIVGSPTSDYRVLMRASNSQNGEWENGVDLNFGCMVKYGSQAAQFEDYAINVVALRKNGKFRLQATLYPDPFSKTVFSQIPTIYVKVQTFLSPFES